MVTVAVAIKLSSISWIFMAKFGKIEDAVKSYSIRQDLKLSGIVRSYFPANQASKSSIAVKSSKASPNSSNSEIGKFSILSCS
jgi:hypothetical protein